MIKNRAQKVVSLEQYGEVNSPETVGFVKAKCPHDKQYILRMLIRSYYDDFKVPEALRWVNPLIEAADDWQKELGIKQPFCYVTVRHGQVESKTDDEWHVDGFSMNITHIPEQNYIWADRKPTEYIERAFDIPEDFSPYEHNLQQFFQDTITSEDEVKTLDERTLFCMDPYVVHRRPTITDDEPRTFVRVSFTPIEIADKNNTENPLLETNYMRDGIRDFRDSLKRYKL